MLVLLHQLSIRLELSCLIALHPLLVEAQFSSAADLLDARHGFEGACDGLAVVAYGDVAALGHAAEEGAVDGKFFAVSAAEGFRPGEFARVALHFEVFVAVGNCISECVAGEVVM